LASFNSRPRPDDRGQMTEAKAKAEAEASRIGLETEARTGIDA